MSPNLHSPLYPPCSNLLCYPKKTEPAFAVIMILILFQGFAANAQLSLSDVSPFQKIDFSATVSGVNNGGFTASGFQSVPGTGQLDSDAWAVTGWSDGNLSFGGTMTSGDYGRGTTTVAIGIGGFYSFIAAPHSASDPALHIQPGGSDWEPGTLTLRILNSGTSAITAMDVSYNLFVRNDQGRSNTFNFSYSADNNNYTAVSALDYTSPAAADANGYIQVGTSPSRSTNITGLNIAPGAYFYVRWSSAAVGGTGSRDEFGLDDITVTATYASALPEINIAQNTTTIVNGGTYTFSATEVGSNTDVVFTIENSGQGTLNITTPLTATGDFSVFSQPNSTVGSSASTNFTVRFTPTTTGIRTGSITILNNDSDESSYVINFSGTAAESASSVVQKVNGSEATTISSINNITTINSATDGQQVWQFRLYDGDGTNNDSDNLPTEYISFTLNSGGGNIVSDWSQNIQDVKFFQNSAATPIAGNVTISANSIQFIPSSAISVTDGAGNNVLISMRLSLKSNLPAGSDGKTFVFQLQKINVSVSSSGSQLGSFSDQTSDNTKNKIDVVATALTFISIPASVGENTNFSITAGAVDANNNIDLNNNSSVTLSLAAGSGIFTVSNSTTALSNGIATWSDANYNKSETIVLQVSGSGLTVATANVAVSNNPFILFDNFNRGTSSTLGNPSSGGSASWKEIESSGSDGSKIRIANDRLTISGCNSNGTGGSSGMDKAVFDMTGKYSTVFNLSSGTMEWLFNVRSSRTDPSFGAATYGTAVVLGSDMDSFKTANASGYAVVIGNINTPDPVKLVRFSGGLKVNSNITDVIVSSQTASTNYYSVRVSYNPTNNEWKLNVRNDGTTAFADPSTLGQGTLSQIDATHVGKNLKYSGFAWQHGALCSESATFDNFFIPNIASGPDIDIALGTTGTVAIASGAVLNFGPTGVSSGSYTATFILRNRGSATLNLSGSPAVALSGTHAADFSITQPAVSTLAPSDFTTFTITFDPSAAGVRMAQLSISSNDADENPYIINLTGTGGVVPVINEFVSNHVSTVRNS